MADSVIVDDLLSMADIAHVRDAVLSSQLLGESPLGGTFSATRGFSITFHRRQREKVEARFPFLASFLHLTLDEIKAERVQRKPLLGGAPRPNAFYVNVLVVPPGAAVGRHVDATLGPPNGSVMPEAVAVLYLDIPEGMRGGRLLLADGDEIVGDVEPRCGRFVLFAGRLGHEVTAVTAPRPRVSVVCEQYALSAGVLSAVPRFKVNSRNAFGAVLEQVRLSTAASAGRGPL